MGTDLSFWIKIYLSLLFVIWLSAAFILLNFTGPLQPLTSFGIQQFLRHKIALRHHESNKFSSPSSLSTKPETTILSRDPAIKVTSDVRGNLGPASVIIQDPPGKDWIHDRWQAAGDMHGTSIPGQHWVILDFGTDAPRHLTKVVVDWEAAYSNDYRVEVSRTNTAVATTSSETDIGEDHSDDWCVLYDAKKKQHASARLVEQYGQSPGVKKKTPLHVLHTIDLEGTQMQSNCASFRYLRIYINNSPTGWGVSIWELDVYGRLSDGI
jgi:hypothetical protein